MAIWGHLYRDFEPDNVLDQARRLFERLRRAGIGTYYFFPVDDEMAYYRSDLLPVRADYLTPMRQAAQEMGVEVHPLLGFGRIAPIAGDRRYRSLARPGREVPFSVDRSACPSWPENRDLLVRVVREIVERYAVDGVQLDYFRYPNRDMQAEFPCTCEACRQRRLGWLGRGELTDDDLRHPAVMHKEIAQKGQCIREALERIRALVHGVGKPLSLAARTHYLDDAVYEGQDWVEFAAAGLVDRVLPMSYSRTQAEFEAFVTEHQRLLAPTPVRYLPGVAKSWSCGRLSTEAFLAQVGVALESGANGLCIFANWGMTEADFRGLESL